MGCLERVLCSSRGSESETVRHAWYRQRKQTDELAIFGDAVIPVGLVGPRGVSVSLPLHDPVTVDGVKSHLQWRHPPVNWWEF